MFVQLTFAGVVSEQRGLRFVQRGERFASVNNLKEVGNMIKRQVKWCFAAAGLIKTGGLSIRVDPCI